MLPFSTAIYSKTVLIHYSNFRIPDDPRASSGVANDPRTAYDDHNYIAFNNNNADEIMNTACTGQRAVAGQDFMITGEWSNINQVQGADETFYKNYFTAQQQQYEKPAFDDKPAMAGWVYWTWKTQTGNPDWDYSLALSMGWIPNGADALEQNVYNVVC